MRLDLIHISQHSERMSRGRPEFLCQWMSLLTWIGMVVDAMLKSTADKKASAIYRTILRQEGSDLLDSIVGPLALAVESGSTMHSSMEGLESKIIQLLTLAAKIWTCSNIPQETPTKEWLREYLEVTLGSGVYDAWEKKDLIWAIYNYFTWNKPEKTVDGVVEAIYDLAILSGLPKPPDGSKVLPLLLSTYKALGLNEVAGVLNKNGWVVRDGRLCRLNRDGDIVHLGRTGYSAGDTNWKASDLVYCGRYKDECRCGKCGPQCGPWDGCPCNACVELAGFSVVNGKAFQPAHYYFGE